MTSPLIGAWETTSEPYQGLMIYTEKHYCHGIMSKNRKPFADEANPTDAEEAEAYRTITAGSGTYSISGSTLTINEEMNRNPSGVGRPARFEFEIDGDMGTMTRISDGVTLTIRRVR